MEKAEIRVGTSGYSFADWRGTFYPEKIGKGKMLDYYVRHFPTVEINSTYYRIPHPKVFENMVRKVPGGFDFMVKVPRSFTHQRGTMDEEVAPFRQAVQPLAESGKLAGLLAQFPYSFRFSADALTHLSKCKEAVAPHRLFCEFRHESWVNRAMYERLKSEHIGYVSVDEPQLAGLLKPDCFATTDVAYIRLHGRNAENWWKGGALRYDYDYSDEELQYWEEKIRRIEEKVKAIYVYFNNCHLGKAPSNAAKFMKLLGIRQA